MIPNPIRKVLSSVRQSGTRALLMGGQACVLYGAAEFSRDSDFALLATQENLNRLGTALLDLRAEVIAVPPFEIEYLERGHAVHFRCRHPDALGLRVDVMSRMRGVAPFEELWPRRTTMELPDGVIVDLLSLPDLVAAKKTQRDKDWPMIRRLLEAHYFRFRPEPTPAMVEFWLRELRTAELLVEVVGNHPGGVLNAIPSRPLLEHARMADLPGLARSLLDEERAERERDRDYWAPLRRELEELRHRG